MNAFTGLTDQHQERITAFKVVCQCDDRTAHYSLLTNNWSMRRATDQYYDDGCRPKNAADLNELLKQRHTLDGHPTPTKKAQEQAVIFKPAPFGSHMQVAISQLFATKELSDVVLVLPGSRIPAHKIVLASGSPVLAAALNSQGEAGAKELALEDEADEAAFHTILAYLYTGKASVASDRVHNLLIAAHRYGVDALKEKCGVYLFQRHLESARRRKKMAAASEKGKEKSEEEEKEEDHVDNVDDDSDDMQVDDADEEGQEGEEAQGVGHLLRLAQTYKCHELEKLCAEDLARNFSTLCESGKLNTLPLSTFIELIKSEKVAAAEEEIFDAVVAYVKFQRDTQGLDEAALLEQLLLFVRFPFIQSQRLVEDVEGNPLIAGLKLTGELLFEAYRYNFYSQLYNQNILSPKSQQPASLSHADGEESLYLDYATKSSTAKGPKFAFTSPLPHYELRCSPRSGAVKWNSTKKSRDITISNNMLTASHNGSSSVWMSVVADVPFSDHLTSIYVHIDRNASNWIFIGVAEEQWMDYAASSGNYLGVSAGTWSHGSAGGYGKVHNGVAGAYGVSFATGDTVGVHLNPETGVLSFSCNGRNYGPAYLSLPVSKRLFLAVSLYHHSDQVTLARGRPKKFKAALNSFHPAAALPTEEEDPNLFDLFSS